MEFVAFIDEIQRSTKASGVSSPDLKSLDEAITVGTQLVEAIIHKPTINVGYVAIVVFDFYQVNFFVAQIAIPNQRWLLGAKDLHTQTESTQIKRLRSER